MKSIDLWASFGGLDPELLERSEKPREPLIRRAVVPTLIAASLALAVLAVSPMLPMGFKSEAPAMDAETSQFGFNDPLEALGEASPEDTGAPQSVDGSCLGLIFNNSDSCYVPACEYEPLPGAVSQVSLGAETAQAVCPLESIREGSAMFYEDGSLLRVELSVPQKGAQKAITLSAAPDLYASDMPPSYRVDNPGDADLSYIGDTECLAVRHAVRAPRGTGWQMTVVFRFADTDYALYAYAAPGEEDAVTAGLEGLIRRICESAAPDFDRIAQEGAPQ